MRRSGIVSALALALVLSATDADARKGNAPDEAMIGQTEAEAATSGADAGEYVPRRISIPFGNAWAGAANGDVTLVVFTDYGWRACREAQKTADRLIAEDPKLKVVFRLMLLSDSRSDGWLAGYDRVDAARPEMELINDGFPGRRAVYASMKVAASRSNVEWYRFHRALMASGATSATLVATSAREAGVPYNAEPPPAPFDENAKLSDFDLETARNGEAMEVTRLVAAPAWAIGDGTPSHGFDYAAIKAAITKARAAKR